MLTCFLLINTLCYVYKIIRFEFEGTCSKATGYFVFFFFFFFFLFSSHFLFICLFSFPLCTAIFYTMSLDRYLDFVPPYFTQRHWTDTGTLYRHILHNVIGQILGLFQRAVHIVQELCESRGGRPGLSVLTSLMVSEDVKQY